MAVLFLLAPGVLLAGATRRVDVAAQVPVVAQVESPSTLELAPGETRMVTIRVACNQPWLLTLQTDNPQIRTARRYAGSAGGMAAAGNTFAITLTCAPEALGLQRTTLATRLVTGPLVAVLPH